MDNIHWFFSDEVDENKISSLSNALIELRRLEEKGLQNTQAYCMYIWSILDLLSRFYSGQLDHQQATKRLKNYLQAYFPHSRDFTKTLILFRNACSHSVTLYASDVSGKKEIRFKLTESGELLTQNGRTSVVVNTLEFGERLKRSIEKYKLDLEKNDLLQSRFEKVFKKLGYVTI